MARAISESVIAVHICDDAATADVLRAKWHAWGDHVPLHIIESPYRVLVRPLLTYIDAIDRQHADDTIVVLLPELVATRWWHAFLHNQTALRLKAALLFVEAPWLSVCLTTSRATAECRASARAARIRTLFGSSPEQTGW